MRQKPHHVKKQYAFLVSLLVTFIIFMFWILSFGIRSKAIAEGVAAPTPISSLTAGVGDTFDYIKGLFIGSNKTQYSSDNVEVVGGGK